MNNVQRDCYLYNGTNRAKKNVMIAG